MADKRPNKITVSPQGGFLRDIVARIKLVGRLMMDRRVNFFLKIIPLASLAYMIWPLDVIVLPVFGVLDDAAVAMLGANLFIELCPPKVVQEHMNELASNMDDSTGDVVDAEATDVDGNK